MVLSELRRPFQNTLFHDFSSFELHDRAGRDDHFLLGLFGIAADTLLSESCSEDAKLAELDALAVGQGISNAVERELDHGEDFLLCEC
jgi:hypothetical protein